MAGKDYLKLADIEIRFVSLDNGIKDAVSTVFSGLSNVSGVKQVIQASAGADCIVSPANSFGQMDGGIDGALSEILSKDGDGDYIGEKVRGVILTEHFGEQPVGTCLMVPTDNEKFPWLAHAPTMTTPMNVQGSFNAYYAFKAVLGEVLKLNRRSSGVDGRIKSILTTTFATGCGGMALMEALEQMRMAYDVVEAGDAPSWRSAMEVRKRLTVLKERWSGVGGGVGSGGGRSGGGGSADGFEDITLEAWGTDDMKPEDTINDEIIAQLAASLDELKELKLEDFENSGDESK